MIYEILDPFIKALYQGSLQISNRYQTGECHFFHTLRNCNKNLKFCRWCRKWYFSWFENVACFVLFQYGASVRILFKSYIATVGNQNPSWIQTKTLYSKSNAFENWIFFYRQSSPQLLCCWCAADLGPHLSPLMLLFVQVRRILWTRPSLVSIKICLIGARQLCEPMLKFC